MATVQDFMQWGSDWLDEVRHAELTQDVVYERPSLGEVTIRATFGKNLHEVTDQFGVHLTIESWDFVFRPADLVILGNLISPIAGDRIKVSAYTGETYIYEVNRLASEPPARDSDRYKRMIRVHSDQFDVVLPITETFIFETQFETQFE